MRSAKVLWLLYCSDEANKNVNHMIRGRIRCVTLRVYIETMKSSVKFADASK